MISISPTSVADLEKYFERSRKNGSIPNSSWTGEIGRSFRSQEPVLLPELLSVFRGFTRDGKVRLFPEQIQKAEPDGWLIQATVPKAIRYIWALAPEKFRIGIEESHQFGVAYCLHSLERSFRGPENGRPESQIPGVLIALVPSDPFQQTDPQIKTDAFMANMLLPLHGRAQRCPLPLLPDELQKKSAGLTSLYYRKLCDRLHSTLGLEFHLESSKEPQVIGVPESLDFSHAQSEKRRGGISSLVQSRESAKFEDWRTQAKSQGWGKVEATALLKHSAKRKTAWSTFESATREKLEKMRNESEPPKKVTKTLFKTTTLTHSY